MKKGHKKIAFRKRKEVHNYLKIYTILVVNKLHIKTSKYIVTNLSNWQIDSNHFDNI